MRKNLIPQGYSHRRVEFLQPATDSELSSRLEEMQRKHDWQAQTRTGAPKLPLLMHQGLARRILCFLAY